MTYDSVQPIDSHIPEPVRSPSPEAAADREASGTRRARQRVDKGGAPAGNRNHLRHGTVSFLMTGRLPPGASYIRRALGRLRVELETAVRNQHGGELSIYHASLVQSALRHEARACLLTRYLRLMGHDRRITTTKGRTSKQRPPNEQGDSTSGSVETTEVSGGTLADRMALLREISAATDSRDKCLEKLKLNEAGPLNTLDAAFAIVERQLAEGEPEPG